MIPGYAIPSAEAATSGTVNSFQKISATQGGFTGSLTANDQFGRGVENIGDLDGDGVTDLAVGAFADDDGGTDRGAVYILFMNSDGTVKSEQKISDTAGGFTGTLVFRDFFGSSVTNLGDLDGAGLSVLALAVGAIGDGPGSGGGFGSGAVYILFLNSDGTVQSHTKIVNGVTNFGTPLGAGDHFGGSVANIGDLDGDGVNDIAVGAEFDDEPFDSGAVYIIFLNSNGTVKSVKKLANGQGGVPSGLFGQQDGIGCTACLTSLGDLDGAGLSVLALAVGANIAPFFSTRTGQVEILFLNSAGTVISSQKIGSGLGGFGTLDFSDQFSPVENMGDLDGDGVTDLAVGAILDDDGGTDRGAVYVLFMKSDGTVKSFQKISDTEGGFTGILDNNDQFGFSIANMGDLDGDGVQDLAVGAIVDDDGGVNFGAVWILFMNGVPSTPPDTTPPVITLVGANPQTIEVDDPYVELGATATDDVDGDITGLIVIDASAVNTATVGSYQVTYDVSDLAGNPATPVTRTVNVVPLPPPVIPPSADVAKGVNIGDGTVLGEDVIIDKDTTLGEQVIVGDSTTINKDVTIGDDTTVGQNSEIKKSTIVGSGVTIGDNTTIEKDVTIGDGAIIGNNVIIKKGAVIAPGAVVPDGTVIPKNSSFP